MLAAASLILAVLVELRGRLRDCARRLKRRARKSVHGFAAAMAGNGLARRAKSLVCIVSSGGAWHRERGEPDSACTEQMFQSAVRRDRPTGPITRREVRSLTQKYVDEDPLAVEWFITSCNQLEGLPLSLRRKLATNLRSRGYLQKSLHVLETIVADTGTNRDKLALKQRSNELSILRDGYKAKLQVPDSFRYEPSPGQILHVVGKGLPATQSGYTLRTHYTVLAQRAAGLHPTVAVQVGEAEELDELEVSLVDDVSYYRLPGAGRKSMTTEEWLHSNVAQLAKVVERSRPALLHAHSDFYNAISAHAVGRAFGIPVVYETRGFWEESWLSRMTQKFSIDSTEELERLWGLPEAYSWRQKREEAARSTVDHVFTLAEVMKVHIEEGHRGLPRVSLVPNAVKAEEFPVLERDDLLANDLAISADTLVIGYISSLVEYEGIDTLVSAFSNVVSTNASKLKLLIVGDGPMLAPLKQQVHDLDLQERVVFTGRVLHDDVLRYYSTIDIFVVPRRPARVCELVTPLKPFEAFSTGRTVVMSDVSALREIATDSEAAELFVAGNPESLADVLSQLISDPQRREELSKRGAEWVRAHRSWESNTETYLTVYDSLGVQPSGTEHREGKALENPVQYESKVS